jgi:hypothetical protein
MTLSLLALYCVLVMVLSRAVLDKLRPYETPSCNQCGLPRERRELGESICGCAHG